MGTRWELEQELAIVFRTARPARRGDYSDGHGSFLDVIRRMGIRSSVAVPIAVEGQLWGALGVATRGTHFPADTECRLTGFAELVATALANTARRAEITRLHDEQAALRRVATLVARRVSPADVLATVAEEAGQLFGADAAAVTRFEPDGTSVLIVASGDDLLGAMPAGTRWALDDHIVMTPVWRTGRPARTDATPGSEASGLFRSAAAGPVVVDGRLWGAMVVATKRHALSPDTEERIANFSELVGSAIGNTESRAELAASRARVVTASDQARRRIERDLHDGAQQQLVSLGLELRFVGDSVPPAFPELQDDIARVCDELDDVLDGLREMCRGIHPSICRRAGSAKPYERWPAARRSPSNSTPRRRPGSPSRSRSRPTTLCPRR